MVCSHYYCNAFCEFHFLEMVGFLNFESSKKIATLLNAQKKGKVTVCLLWNSNRFSLEGFFSWNRENDQKTNNMRKGCVARTPIYCVALGPCEHAFLYDILRCNCCLVSFKYSKYRFRNIPFAHKTRNTLKCDSILLIR